MISIPKWGTDVTHPRCPLTPFRVLYSDSTKIILGEINEAGLAMTEGRRELTLEEYEAAGYVRVEKVE